MDIKAKEITLFPTSKLSEYPRNANKHTDEQINKIIQLIEFYGHRDPLIVDADIQPDGTHWVLAGNGRLQAAKKAGWDNLPCVFQVFKSDEEKYGFMVSHNAVSASSWGGGLDLSQINTDIIDFGPELDIEMLAIKDFELLPEEKYSEGEKGSMEKNFIAPPFSVLDTRQEYWQSRMKKWLGLGIKGEEGRKNGLMGGGIYGSINKGTSIFDPVLTEIAYSWFCPPEGIVLDCFAGGSTRGIVCSHTGRQYIGVELRKEQVEANKNQEEISIEPKPVWHCGDSQNIDKICENVEADFVFSCPPYADLEIYSDDPRDISNMDYADFKVAYFNIIKKTVSLLKDNSFACFVVGEVRGKNGNYLNFISDTIQAFEEAGAEYYNEIILINSAGSLPMRAGNYFKKSRKIGKMHQNVLVFVKGDAKQATKRCGHLEIMELSNDE